jgi:hypothetical protein
VLPHGPQPPPQQNQVHFPRHRYVDPQATMTLPSRDPAPPAGSVMRVGFAPVAVKHTNSVGLTLQCPVPWEDAGSVGPGE